MHTCWTQKFTFQYGEIKRRRCLPSWNLLPRFTFQYGEIKSAGLSGSNHRQQIFTFQYGEIKRKWDAVV